MMLDDSSLLKEKELDFIEKSEEIQSDPQTLLFFLLGNASLLAFNLIINAIDIYAKVTNNSNIGTDLNRAYNFPCSLTALLLCFYKPKNLKFTIITALILLTIILCSLPLMILIELDSNVVYWGTMILVGLTGIVSSTIFSSSYSISSQFSAESGAAVSSGNGGCGVLAASLRIITKAAFSSASAIQFSSAAYFFIGASIIFGTLIYFLKKIQNPFIYKKVNPTLNYENNKEQSIFSSDMIQTIKIIWPLWSAEFINFMITLSIFPGYVTSVKQLKSIGDWTPVIITTLFCIFDWIGRYFPAKVMWPSEKNAWIPILFRFLFFPLEIISLQNIINLYEPFWTFLLMIPFALTNGYFGTVAMVHGSNHSLLTFEQKRFAGLLMSFGINAGILAAMTLTFIMPKPINN